MTCFATRIVFIKVVLTATLNKILKFWSYNKDAVFVFKTVTEDP